VDQTQRGAQAPNVQPFDPKESFTLKLELDAADDLENGDAVTVLVGVADRLAALKKADFADGRFDRRSGRERPGPAR
jgi:hypothetical protein